MAEKHDYLQSKYRARLIRRKYKIEKKSPFVDYRPDICATKRKEMLFVEVEIEQTLHNDHTFEQLKIMYKYLRANRNTRGILVVPRSVKEQACFLIESVFGDNRIRVEVR